MKRSILILSLWLLFDISTSIAQHTDSLPARNSIYGEIGGYGMFFSLNYERLLPEPFLLRVGISEWNSCGWTGECNHLTAVPLGVSYLIGGLPPILGGGPTRWIELGAGVIPGVKGYGRGEVADRTGFLSFAGTLGLRRQPLGSGFMYRVAFTPVLTLGEKEGFPANGFMGYGGISIGYAF